MTIEEEKQQLIENIQSLLTKPYVGRYPSVGEKLENLLDQLNKDVLTIVVLGEFSRGKSTFVNALLGNPLIPMDVLPETAAIHAIVYGENPAVTVVHSDGTKEKGRADSAYLKHFSAQNKDLNRKDIQYLRIAYPADFLKPRIMLVDTPGVSDMDDQRAEITYGFIPQADAVIFLLDATAPLKKTEKEFIEKRLLPQGINNIVFVANKYDNIDEEEAEEADLLGRLERRLNTAFQGNGDSFGLEKIELFPLSSTMALRGIEEENAELLVRSGMKKLQVRLQQLFSMGERELAKLGRFRWRYVELVRMLSSEMIAERSLVLADRNSLLSTQQQLNDLRASYQRHGDHIGEYVEQSRQKIIAMTDKSLKYFHNHLEDDVMTLVADYRGTDFKEFVETRLLKRIQKEIDHWLGVYGPHIDQLVQKMGRELAAGLSRHFKTKIQIDTVNRSVVQGVNYGIQVTAADISYTDVQAGAIAAAGGIALTLWAGSILMPFVSFAAMPMIRKKLLDQRLGTAKEALLPELQNQLIECMVTLQEELHRRIGEQCSKAEKNVGYAYEQLLRNYQEKLQQQLDLQENAQSRLHQKISSIDEELTDLEGYRVGGI